MRHEILCETISQELGFRKFDLLNEIVTVNEIKVLFISAVAYFQAIKCNCRILITANLYTQLNNWRKYRFCYVIYAES